MGVRIDIVSKVKALQVIEEFLISGEQRLVFTPNPEMLVKAGSDGYFKEILNRGSLNLCDGVGMVFAGRLSGQKISRLPGVDFMVDLCELAEQKKYSIYLLGSLSDEVLKMTSKNLLKKFPELIIAGYDRGPMVADGPGRQMSGDQAVIDRINEAKPDILFVAFGMGKQEKWLAENLSKMPSVKIGMGVGGAFDYLSGTVSRAPRLMRKIGLEWLYRLLNQPRRFGRIFNATLRFSYLILKEKV